METTTTTTSTTPWSLAVMLLTRWLENSERVDALLESLPREAGGANAVTGVERARCQNLLYGAIRHKGRIEAHLRNLIARPPRPRLQAVLLVAGFELLDGAKDEPAAANPARSIHPALAIARTARIVHHAVEQTKTLASEPEARLVNAVVRKLAAALATETEPPKLASAAQLASWYSHPDWLVQRWLAQFGATHTRALLEWNQRPAPVYARWRTSAPVPAWLTPTVWKNFHEVQPGNWPAVEAAIAAGDLYLQDPSTRLAIELLAPRAGEYVLDACAAPGGKTIALADAMIAQSECRAVSPKPPSSAPATSPDIRGAFGERALPALIAALDLPTARIDRLKENLSRIPATADVKATLLEGDLLRADTSLFTNRSLPHEYDAVLLDAPCSNTGVMRHRVDVKWRLQPNDFTKHARQQLALLEAAARRVAAGGRLVYSTCSIDAEENERVVTAFLENADGPGGGGKFTLEKSSIAQPWTANHDGAGAFLLRHKQ